MPKNKKHQKRENYFSNNIKIDNFSEMMIQDLASIKVIKKLFEDNNLSNIEIEKLENRAFNLLVNQIEFEKGNTQVEVGVIGSFSSGKSTFINSLFGKAICPTNVKPTTSSITKFYYGSPEKITINDKEITQNEYHNLAQHQKEETQNNKTDYIEYAYPFERLNSIILYDTPGFNNNLNENDTAITMKTLESVDVILFVVDISKGALDSSSIELLSTLKDKRMYCILNKSDLKSTQAITKIKNEILSKKIFLEVVEYSSIKVLEFGEKDYFDSYIQHIQDNFIPNKINFDINIKGITKETKSRLKTKVEYHLFIDENRFIIDDFYTSAKKQRDRIEKMFTRIAESKQSTIQQKLKLDRATYHKDILNLIKRELNNCEKIKVTLQSNIIIDKFKSELNQFEKNNISKFYNELNYAFKSSCHIEYIEKKEKYFSYSTYRKISFDKKIFQTKIEEMDSSKYLKELISRWIKLFKKNYNIQLSDIDLSLEIYEEAVALYSNAFDENILFQDMNEAREYLESFLNFKHKDTITVIHTFLEKNQENIEQIKSESATLVPNNMRLKPSSPSFAKSLLEKELKQFIKDKEEYVKSLQK